MELKRLLKKEPERNKNGNKVGTTLVEGQQLEERKRNKTLSSETEGKTQRRYNLFSVQSSTFKIKCVYLYKHMRQCIINYMPF